MNERIKELATVAGWYENPHGDDVILDKDFAEKFAELIIKECAVLVDSNISDNGYGVADSWCQGKDLLEHFGVE